MRKYVSDTAELTEEYGIQIGRWKQYRDLGRLPFDAMWCVIPPGGSSTEDVHPEVEFAVVTRGTAIYQAGGEKVEVLTGGVILLDPEQRHVIHNPSPEQPLTILSIYWMPRTNSVEAPDTGDGVDNG
ncbi:cupin domain-containing protein [Plantactinospora sp. GCM10030261]|uniref:cupin domain-containing protein n=1 Tax=Plantactinospora sp. GCM10030261 TaxID=3273420 RepID=UPI003607DB68